MNITRRNFIKSSTIIAASSGLSAKTFGAQDDIEFKKSNYDSLRKQMRAFYPDSCRGSVKDQRQISSVKKIAADIRAWASKNKHFDALDIRRESYKSMSQNFAPFIFSESPFYFEAGVNGGWSGSRPNHAA